MTTRHDFFFSSSSWGRLVKSMFETILLLHSPKFKQEVQPRPRDAQALPDLHSGPAPTSLQPGPDTAQAKLQLGCGSEDIAKQSSRTVLDNNPATCRCLREATACRKRQCPRPSVPLN